MTWNRFDAELADTLAVAPRGKGVPHEERCRAMSLAGNRCPFRATAGVLCKRHNEYGAIIPDDWTQPDNLPVWLRAAG